MVGVLAQRYPLFLCVVSHRNADDIVWIESEPRVPVHGPTAGLKCCGMRKLLLWPLKPPLQMAILDQPKAALPDPSEDALLSAGGALGSLSPLEDVKMGAGQPHEEQAKCVNTPWGC